MTVLVAVPSLGKRYGLSRTLHMQHICMQAHYVLFALNNIHKF